MRAARRRSREALLTPLASSAAPSSPTPKPAHAPRRAKRLTQDEQGKADATAPAQLPELAKGRALTFARRMLRLHPELRNPRTARSLGRYLGARLIGEVQRRRDRGRPKLPDVDKAEERWQKFKKEFPEEDNQQRLDRICPDVIEGWTAMPRKRQVRERKMLGGRLRSRRNQRVRRRAKQIAPAIVPPETTTF